jgi:hypothetical protein
MYHAVEKCRICGNRDLIQVLDLGEQTLTGVFPRSPLAKISSGPLRLVKCHGGMNACGLLQLAHSYESSEVYGENYGYRSGLNPIMVAHLQERIAKVLTCTGIDKGDLVVDIGSNDSTTLQAYPDIGATLLGIDPTGRKFQKYYPPRVSLVPDFFGSRLLKERYPGRKAKIITSFAMFYDLDDPISFMGEVRDVLADDGVWMFEQSYMPKMMEANAYDTVCHEHLEYYGLRQIKWMTDAVGLEILDVEFNDTNGGSFCVIVRKTSGQASENSAVANALDKERSNHLHELTPYRAFGDRVEQSRRQLQHFVAAAKSEGKTVAALGASTKGNVVLQYCGFHPADIGYIGDVNEDKFGCYTPGTGIPIISEAEALGRKADYYIVMPWHFRTYFECNSKFLPFNLVFPLPELEVRPGQH